MNLLHDYFDKNLTEQIFGIITSIENNDLINKQTQVLNRLTTIRVAKKKMINNLQLLIDNSSKEDENTNQELILRIIQSYDALKDQENDFVAAMKQISENFSNDLDNVTSKLDEKKMQLQTANISQENKKEEINEEIGKLIFKFNNMKKMLSDVSNLSKEAIDSSVLLDQQLKIRLDIYLEMKRKKALLQQLQIRQVTKESTVSTQKSEQIANQNSNSDRKQRQLERLRREAVRRGIVNKNISTENNSLGEEIKEPFAESKSKSDDDNRIPPIQKFQIDKIAVDSEKKSDKLRTKISERFSSIDAKKQRMKNIQTKLNNLQKLKMEKAYEEALKRFKNLTEVRKQLEDLQNITQKLESDEIINHVIDVKGVEGSTSEFDESEANPNNTDKLNESVDDNHSSVSTNELVEEVRRAFNATFNPQAHPTSLNKSDMAGTSLDSQTTVGNFPGSSSFESAFSTLGDRLKSIESILHNHTDQLIWIGNQCEDDSTVKEQEKIEQQYLPINEESNNRTTQVVSCVMECLKNEVFNKEFTDGNDKSRIIDTDLTQRIVQFVIDQTFAICPVECQEKIKNSLPLVVEGVISLYIAKKFGEVEKKITQELSDALHSELSFIFLINNANTIAIE